MERSISTSVGAGAITGIVDRPRLNRILDTSLVRVCVVQGPSGSGKTTLLGSWALQQAEDMSVVWISLGPGITNRRTFWRKILASAEQRGQFSADVTIEAQEELAGDVDPVRLVSRLFARAGPVVLVLDAYEQTGNFRHQIDDDLIRLIGAVPELRVMLATRGTTALTDVVVRDGFTRVIPLSELALTPDEISALIVEQTGLEDARLAVSISAATRGFPLSVRAVVLALSQLGRAPRTDLREWAAIASAQLDGLLPDSTVVQFVADTTVPPYVDSELAQTLSENPDARRLLDMLEREGFGRWIPHTQERSVFQYVEIIRELFRARAEIDPARLRRSSAATARWLLDNDENIDEALQFAIDGGDYALADRIFVSMIFANLENYFTDRFLTSLRAVPKEVLSDYPMLAFGLGMALMANPILRVEAPSIFQLVVNSPARPSYVEPAIDAFSLASMRAIAHRLALAYPESAEASLHALTLVDDIEPRHLSQFGDHIGTVLRQLSFSIWQGGHIDSAIATANRSVALCTKPESLNYSTVYSAGISAFAGDSARASELLSSIDATTWPADMRNAWMNGLGFLAEAYESLDNLDFVAAADILRDTHGFMRSNEYWPFITAALVHARRGLGHAREEAERVTAELGAHTPPPGIGSNVATEQLHAAVAFAWMAGGDYRQAAEILERQPQDSPHLGSARTAWLLGEQRDAKALQQAQLSLALPGHTIRTRAETQTLGAVAALRQHEPEVAWSWLSSAALSWENYGTKMHVALTEPRDHRRLHEFAQDRGSVVLQAYLQVPDSIHRIRPTTAALSEREHAVLVALAEHGTTLAIAEALFVSPSTVKSQLQSIYRKLGVSSRSAACAVARKQGLL